MGSIVSQPESTVSKDSVPAPRKLGPSDLRAQLGVVSGARRRRRRGGGWAAGGRGVVWADVHACVQERW